MPFATGNKEAANDVAVVPPSNPGPTTQPQPAVDHYDAVSTSNNDDFCEACLPMLCSVCLELTKLSLIVTLLLFLSPD